jgi:putative nucleotidyltransferase with HDIG domain
VLPPELKVALDAHLEGGKLELPLLPEVAGQVLVATMGQNPEPGTLTQLLRRDQALSGHVLRIANSPLYKPRLPIFTLERAVVRLGLKALREIAAMVACQTKVFTVPRYAMEVRDLFRHSLGTAIYAQEIAKLLRWQDEAAFLCGLLHDVGRPVLIQALSDLQDETGVEADAESVFAACDDLHAEMGAKLIRSWGLPEMFSEPVCYHHSPEEAPERTRYGAMMTCLADDLAHYALGPRRVDPDVLLGHSMLIHLGLHSVDVERLIMKSDEVTTAVEALG